MKSSTSVIRFRWFWVSAIVLVATMPAFGQFCAPGSPPPAGPPPQSPDPQCETCTRVCRRSPCYVGTGVYTTSATDISIRTTGTPLDVTRTYQSDRVSDGPFGIGWTSSITPRLHVTRLRLTAEVTSKEVYITMASGFTLRFTAGSSGTWVAPLGRRENLQALSGGAWSLALLPSGTVMSFNAAGQLTSIADEFGNGLSYAYDSNGRLTTVSDLAPSGRSLTVVHGATGRIDTITDSTGRVLRYEYDSANGSLLRVFDPSSATVAGTNYTYTAGRLGSVLSRIQDRWDREITRLVWNAAGKLESYTEGEFDDANPTNSPGEKYTYAYFAATTTTPERAVKTDTLGSHTYPYDGAGRVTDDSVYDAYGRVTRTSDATSCRDYTYDARGNIATATVRQACESSPIVTWTYTPDAIHPDKPATVVGTTGWSGSHFAYVPAGTAGAGLVKEARRLGNNGVSTIVAAYTYNSRGQVLTAGILDSGSTVLTYYPSGDVHTSTHNGVQLTYELDALGRVTKVTGPGTRATSYTYDVLDRIKSVTLPEPSAGFAYVFKTEYTYDYDTALGLNYTEVKDPNNQITRSSFNELGHLVRSTDALGNVTKYTYRQNLLKSIEDANGNITTYAYNADRRLESTTFPGGGIESYGYTGDMLTAVTDRRGIQRTYLYDALGRMTGLSFPGRYLPGTQITLGVSWAYSGEFLNQASDTMVSPAAVTTFMPDDWYRPVTEQQPDGRTLTYVYVSEPASQRLHSYTLAPPAGSGTTELSHTVTYAYDGSNRISGLVSSRLGSNGFSFTYTADGSYNTITYPNGQQRKYLYDGQGRVTKVENVLDQQYNFATFDYTYDFNWDTNSYTRLGQRTGVAVSSPNGALGAGAHYRYDANYQLTRADDLTGAGAWESWQYDAIGNRMARTFAGGSIPYTYSPANSQRLTQAGNTSYAYDGNGNVTSFGGQNLVWDELNRLSTYASVQKTYDFAGRRISQVFAGAVTKYVHHGSDLIREITSTPSKVTDFVFGPGIDEPLARISRAPIGGGAYADQIEYLSADALGSIVAANDPTGANVTNWRYTEWGEPYNLPSSFGYTAREPGNPGLFYRARYYDPTIGRFISEDPVRGFHPYAYVESNPLYFVDPSGAVSVSRSTTHHGMNYADSGARCRVPTGRAMGCTLLDISTRCRCRTGCAGGGWRAAVSIQSQMTVYAATDCEVSQDAIRRQEQLHVNWNNFIINDLAQAARIVEAVHYPDKSACEMGCSAFNGVFHVDRFFTGVAAFLTDFFLHPPRTCW